nr:MAG TPA: hypothetical protein [Caudoviricetes sp.]
MVTLVIGNLCPETLVNTSFLRLPFFSKVTNLCF